MTSWRERATALMRDGRAHAPEATDRFAYNMGPNASGMYGHHGAPTVEQCVEGLPAMCRRQAEAIVAEARAAGASDDTIRGVVEEAHRNTHKPIREEDPYASYIGVF
ncbi:MAG: hypothetical protein Q7S96_05080 [bacterium]|nr:hypothetical protein [bacterium]